MSHKGPSFLGVKLQNMWFHTRWGLRNVTTCDKGGGGLKKSWNLCDVIYEWPLRSVGYRIINPHPGDFNRQYESWRCAWRNLNGLINIIMTPWSIVHIVQIILITYFSTVVPLTSCVLFPVGLLPGDIRNYKTCWKCRVNNQKPTGKKTQLVSRKTVEK